MPRSDPFSATAEQLAVQRATSARTICTANAGTGKTTTAAMKIAHLLAQGANPARVAALSFTEPGVQALRAAFQRLNLPEGVAGKLRVGTVEELCTARLKPTDGGEVRRLAQPGAVRPFVLQAIASARQSADARYPGHFGVPGSGELAVEGLLNELARIKGTMQLVRQREEVRISPAFAAEIGVEFTVLAVFQAYERLRCGWVNGDREVQFRYAGDATYDLAELLEADEPGFATDRHPLKLGLQAVILDEMHDSNWAVFTILRHLLAQNPGALFLGVGDPDQVIHSHHGAEPDFMKERFEQYIGAAERLPLTVSHRFGGPIAAPLGRFSAKPYRAGERASRVDLRVADSAREIFNVINEVLQRRPEVPRSGTAVLLRFPHRAVGLEHELRRRGMAYQTAGFTTYLERPEVLFLRMLLMAALKTPEQLAHRILRAAKLATWEFIGGSVRSPADREDPTATVVAESTQPNFIDRILPELIARTESLKARTQVSAAMALARSDNVRSMPAILDALRIGELAERVLVRRQVIEDVEHSVSGLVQASQDYESISSFVRSLIAHDYAASSDHRVQDRLTLSSIDAAKGLEFDQVIVPEVNTPEFDGTGGDSRNLFYVAASRARDQLTFTHRAGRASSYLAPFRSA